MTPRRVEPSEGDQPGTCFEACVASIIDYAGPLPRFGHICWWDKAVEWTRSMGWELTWTPMIEDRANEMAPRGLAIACGPRLTFDEKAGGEHAVVVKDGYLIHDPAEPRRGLYDVVGFAILIPFVYLGRRGEVTWRAAIGGHRGREFN